MGDDKRRDRDDDDSRPSVGGSSSGIDPTPIVVGSVVTLNSGGYRFTATAVTPSVVEALGCNANGDPNTISAPPACFRKLKV
jgi:hypothetical protein